MSKENYENTNEVLKDDGMVIKDVHMDDVPATTGMSETATKTTAENPENYSIDMQESAKLTADKETKKLFGLGLDWGVSRLLKGSTAGIELIEDIYDECMWVLNGELLHAMNVPFSNIAYKFENLCKPSKWREAKRAPQEIMYNFFRAVFNMMKTEKSRSICWRIRGSHWSTVANEVNISNRLENIWENYIADAYRDRYIDIERDYEIEDGLKMFTTPVDRDDEDYAEAMAKVQEILLDEIERARKEFCIIAEHIENLIKQKLGQLKESV